MMFKVFLYLNANFADFTVLAACNLGLANPPWGMEQHHEVKIPVLGSIENREVLHHLYNSDFLNRRRQKHLSHLLSFSSNL